MYSVFVTTTKLTVVVSGSELDDTPETEDGAATAVDCELLGLAGVVDFVGVASKEDNPVTMVDGCPDGVPIVDAPGFWNPPRVVEIVAF